MDGRSYDASFPMTSLTVLPLTCLMFLPRGLPFLSFDPLAASTTVSPPLVLLPHALIYFAFSPSFFPPPHPNPPGWHRGV